MLSVKKKHGICMVCIHQLMALVLALKQFSRILAGLLNKIKKLTTLKRGILAGESQI